MAQKIMLRDVRLSYEHIFTPTSFDDSQDAKYSATFILPKNHPDLPAALKAVMEAGKEKFGNSFEGETWPKGYTCSLKDADVVLNGSGETLAEANAAYAGCYIIEANSTRRPVVLNRNKSALTADDGVIYSGCYVNASLNATGYEVGKVKKGVKCYLNGVQFVKDGERLGSDASSDFEDLDDDFAR